MKVQKIANNISDKNRLRKYRLFINYFNPKANTKILDVGASEREYQDNANILEKQYPYPENITVLGIDKYNEFCKSYPKVDVITYNSDGKKFPFKDNEFDICWCSAVIEHVGDRGRQEKLLQEINRVSKQVFITTPNRWFPFEVHTKIPLLHYLPKKIFDRILLKTNKSWASGDYMHLLGLKDIKKILEKCAIRNYKIIKNKIFNFTVDFVILVNK